MLLVTRTNRYSLENETGNSQTREKIDREEVTEFSEMQLACELFVPPRNSKRVTQLPDGVRYQLAYRMRLYWKSWKDTLKLPGRIAKFVS